MPTKDKALKAKHQKDWYERNKDRHKRNVAERNKRVIAENRKRIQEAGYTCQHCGEDDFVVIEFHHEDPTTKEYDVGAMIGRALSWTRIEAEIAKCIPLCANCHRREHWRRRTGP